MLNTASQTVEALRLKMDQTAATLPEYPVVMAMNGVGPSLGPQLMAEIGDVTRFIHRGALTAFAGVDPGKNDSGKYNQKSVPTSKKGSPSLRKTLFQIMDGLIKRSPVDDPVYAFMDKKRSKVLKGIEKMGCINVLCSSKASTKRHLEYSSIAVYWKKRLPMTLLFLRRQRGQI